MTRADALRLVGQLEGARVKRAELGVHWDRGRRYEVLDLEVGFRGKRRDVRLVIPLAAVEAYGSLVTAEPSVRAPAH